MKEVIVVDLDGTLIRTDLLIEALVSELKRNPLGTIRKVLTSRTDGELQLLKSELSETYQLEAESLPYHSGLLFQLQAAKSEGQEIWLATASPEKWGQAVVNHVQLFDGLLATNSENGNLKGRRKRDVLVDKFGAGQFTYIGNSGDDKVVGDAAKFYFPIQAINRGKLSILETPGRVSEAGKKSVWSSAFWQLRPHQWLKNILLFLAPVAAQITDRDSWLTLFLAFTSFSMLASALYIFNDIFDLVDDRRHPKKSKRPLASGELSLGAAVGIAGSISLVSVLIGAVIGSWFLLALVMYGFASALYSFRLKRVPVLDLLALAFLYWIRVIAGALAVSVPVSALFQLFIVLLFFSLASVKRFGEGTRSSDAKDLGDLSSRGYLGSDLAFLRSAGTSSGILAAFVLGVYSLGDAVRALYSQPDLLLISSLMLWVWLLRLWFLAGRGKIESDPVLFAVKDPVSIALGLITASAMLLAI